MARAFALQPEGLVFEPQSSPTKDFKNGTYCLLFWPLTSENSVKVKNAELPVAQPLIAAFTAFADLWPRATSNGDGHCPLHQWRVKYFSCKLFNHSVTTNVTYLY